MPFVPTSITCIDHFGEPDPNERFLIETDLGHVLSCGAEPDEDGPGGYRFVLDPASWPAKIREADSVTAGTCLIPPLEEVPAKAIVQSDMRTGRILTVKVQRDLNVEGRSTSSSVTVSLGTITGFTVPAPLQFAPTA